MRTTQRLRYSIWILVALVTLIGAPAVAQELVSDQEITFTRDVAPIIQRSCVGCHRPDEVAPMSLRTYEEVRPWSRSIKNRIQSREMPPWHLDRHIGIQRFKNDPSLTETEIATIVRWVDTGAKRGNPNDMPTLREFGDADQWQLAHMVGQQLVGSGCQQ